MSCSDFRKKPNEKNITKKMILKRLEDVSQLTVALEATLTEWEIWYQMIKNVKENLTQEEFEYYVTDGPIFSEIPDKIMKSVREQIKDQLGDLSQPKEERPPVLDNNGNVASDKKLILDKDGKPII